MATAHPNPKVDALFATSTRWRAEEARLRALLLDLGLTEELKWGKACYTHQGTNVALIMSMKGYCALGFLKGALLEDRAGALVAPGAHSQAMRQLRFTEGAQIEAQRANIEAYVRGAMALAASGARVDFAKTGIERPSELDEAFDADPDYGSAFAALTPGRQRSHVLHVSGAKQASTRRRRVAKIRDKVLAGLGFNERPARTKRRGGPPGPATDEPRRLFGGNPQVPKDDGEAPVQAYLTAMPGWKQDIGRALDALITKTVREVIKGVRWNSPFYGLEGRGWFMSIHCYERYVKVTFFRGAELVPPPAKGSKHPEVRYAHLHEGEAPDDEVWTSWIQQAAKLPGWVP